MTAPLVTGLSSMATRDVLSDLAVMASCERMPRMGSLLWSIEKLSEKFADDARKIVSAQIATGVDHE